MLIIATDLATSKPYALDPAEITDVSQGDDSLNACVVRLCSGRSIAIDIPYEQVEAIVLARDDHDEHLAKMRNYGDRPPKDYADAPPRKIA